MGFCCTRNISGVKLLQYTIDKTIVYLYLFAAYTTPPGKSSGLVQNSTPCRPSYAVIEVRASTILYADLGDMESFCFVKAKGSVALNAALFDRFSAVTAVTYNIYTFALHC